MKELKYLIKVLAVFWLLPTFSANAQILNMGVNFEKLDLPAGFLQSLEKCESYKGEKPYSRNEVKVNTVYQIIGMQNDLCVLKIDGSTNTSVNIHQECKLPLKTVATYAKALRRYQSKGYNPRWDEKYIQKNRDYQTALEIMSDTELCRFYRDKIDNTSVIRENLAACNPAEETEITAGLKVTRAIVGTDGKICRYRMSLQKAETEEPLVKSLSDNPEDFIPEQLELVFECEFDKEMTDFYLQVLEAQVIPAEEGFDYSAAQRISPQEEIGFIMDSCILKTDK